MYKNWTKLGKQMKNRSIFYSIIAPNKKEYNYSKKLGSKYILDLMLQS